MNIDDTVSRAKEALARVKEEVELQFKIAEGDKAFHMRLHFNEESCYVQCAIMTKDHMATLATVSVETFFNAGKLLFKIPVTSSICNMLPEARTQFEALTIAMRIAEMVDRYHVQRWNEGQ